jgi:peptidoglycan/xylan/chitin deacetylase (PgdA/CDA1 family)
MRNRLYALSSFISKFQSDETTIFPFCHTDSNSHLAHIKNLYEIKNLNQFEKDIEYLVKNYKILNPKDLIENALNDKPQPNNSFVLTFDDGLGELYTNILPVLEKKGIPCIVFVNNNFIDNRQMFYRHKVSIIIEQLKSSDVHKRNLEEISKLLDLEEVNVEKIITSVFKLGHTEDKLINKLLQLVDINIEEYLSEKKPYLSKEQLISLTQKGFYFGGHTENHFPLNKLSREDQIKEIINSVKWLQDNININYSIFSFPFRDNNMPISLFEEVLEEDPNMVFMGSSGIISDYSSRMLQRFAFENPKYNIEQEISVNKFYQDLQSLRRKQFVRAKN